MTGAKKQRRKKKLRFQESMGITVFVILVLLCAFIAGTVAYLQREAKLVNVFSAGNVKVEVEETFENDVKKDVSLKNSGSLDAYLRAEVLMYYEDEQGSVVGAVPVENIDYSIVWGDTVSNDWIKSPSGYYYYKNPVPGGKNTSVLIRECKPIENANIHTDNHLVVNILTEAIQAGSAQPIQEAWGNDVEVQQDGTLKAKDTAGGGAAE